LSEETAARKRPPLFDEFGGNAVLLLTLIVLLTVLPLFPGDRAEGIISRLVWTAVVMAGLARASGRRFFLWSALLIAIPSVLSRWFEIPGGAQAGPFVLALFFLLISAQMLSDIFKHRQIQTDQVLGGVNVYLLLGVMFARLHVGVETLVPDSYMLGGLPIADAAGAAGSELEDVFQYFSFATLTTLGYGDIRPVGHAARVLSTTEAVVGQLFIAIFIARLVSIHATRPEGD